MNTLNKNLQSFFVCTFILQIFGLIRLKEKETFCEIILSRLRLTFFIASFLVFFRKVVTTPDDDLMLIYSQYIERAATIISCVLIMIEFFIIRHDHGKIFKIISEIDDILLNKLKIKINHRRNLFLNCLIFSANLILIYEIVLNTANVISFDFNFTSFFFLIFTFPWFLICVIVTFYISIVLQIYLIFKKVGNFLHQNNQNFNLKDVINEILMKTITLIEAINEVFGISILITAGECKRLSRTLIIQCINLIVKLFIKIATRVYVLFHVLTYYKINFMMIFRKFILKILKILLQFKIFDKSRNCTFFIQ